MASSMAASMAPALSFSPRLSCNGCDQSTFPCVSPTFRRNSRLRKLIHNVQHRSRSNARTTKLERKLRVVAEAAPTDSHGVQTKTAEGAVANGQALPTAPPSEKSENGNKVPENLESPDGYHGWNEPNTSPFLSIIVLGATGDLARNKIFPALFALYYSGNLYKKIAIFGYSRSELTDEEFRDMLSESATCRVDEGEKCEEAMETFLQSVYYESGGYSTCDGMKKLDSRLKKLEGMGEANRIFYLSVPHEVVPDVSKCLSRDAESKTGWTRLIVEKPFGVDSESSAKLADSLLQHLDESQIYRIDHHLGKELIENLTILRFSNLVFEPLWTRTYIKSVQVLLAEDWGMEGKGGYFDQQGIIRDIVQSHLMQTIALFAMEPPVSLDDEDIRNEKVKVLRSMRMPSLQDFCLGQYKASVSKDGKSRIRSYLEEPGVNPNSLTPTFVAGVLYIDNARWDGVPFLIKAGYGLIKHKVEIRIQFHHVPGNLYREQIGMNMDMASNELIIAVQPEEAIFLKINNKVPGLGTQLDSSELNLLYKEKYDGEVIPDSYERLILDVITGDNHLFIRSDELQATWDLLTPLLKEIEELKVAPEMYTFGGRGPVGAYYLGAKHGVRWADE
ncbi:glucose-6-phosphate 1-dehydrogenase, chloroplastic [Physcomitrium patens]|uniref:Glucose-6-phosphate 1-dehydrogenase n=1 Tax=Physcomitrium patens TaxID=3218 RepID=A9SYA8_PHYPA|nr:glucose-6-phosphate 1-dehydrogenase, chloroplastic-like isoform X2 [Physcomitrium patens]PNR50617.1 hypothetical protein PHYPA_009803 [Physcomitrium patens]|eukprot:XP_024381277.1 glucose-6-phosphate 1-dehydrogenase, chloroplastic-like isoform X2 [Physcomitrella patens]